MDHPRPQDRWDETPPAGFGLPVPPQAIRAADPTRPETMTEVEAPGGVRVEGTPSETKSAGVGPSFDEPPPPFWQDAPVRPSGRRSRSALVAFVAALLGAAVGVAATLNVVERTPTVAGEDGLPGVVRVGPPVEEGGGAASGVAGVAQAVLPSVVHIQAGRGLADGTGSGVIFSTDGFIITNNHVIEGARSISVRLSTGDQLDAAVVGTAWPVVDVAVLKVAGSGLPAAVFGSSKDLRVGEVAVAVGSPFGLEGTVTSGVISALNRAVPMPGGQRFSDAIQTDAPINPGNSGGALANARGEVIGINTAILSDGGGNVGVGFAIPIDIARKVAEQIIATGSVRLAFLGVNAENLPEGRGALVRSIVEGSPAEAAGILPDDTIVGLDGEPIRSMDDLISRLLERDVGERVEVEVIRAGERHMLSAVLAPRPAMQ